MVVLVSLFSLPCSSHWPALFQLGANLACNVYVIQAWYNAGVTLPGVLACQKLKIVTRTVQHIQLLIIGINNISTMTDWGVMSGVFSDSSSLASWTQHVTR